MYNNLIKLILGTRVVFSFPTGKGLTIVIAQVGFEPTSGLSLSPHLLWSQYGVQ